MPAKETIPSCSGRVRATVTPADIDSQLAYFEAKARGTEPAGPREWRASVRVERIVDGVWHPVWEAPLVNEVAPVSVLIRDDASRLVTLDDWHGTGYGPNVVVVYGPAGERRYRFALKDIVPQWYADAMPHSVSSIQWRGRPAFAAGGRHLLLPIAVPAGDRHEGDDRVTLSIDLDEGTVAPLDPGAWKRALSAGRQVGAAQIAAAQATTAAFRAPLLGPPRGGQREWHRYLREAVARTVGDAETPATKVLRSPASADYAESERWLRDALTDRFSDVVAAASIDAGTLAPVLSRIAASTRPGALSQVRLFVAVGRDEWPAIVDAMAGTGATLIRLDPAAPIPQRPERIARRFGA